MKTEVLFSSAKDEWSTPQDLFDILDSKYHFDLDVCASADNAKCKKFYTKDEDGLAQPWNGHTVWCNPPYGRGVVDKWVRKAWWVANCGSTVVMLLPARTDTNWFHEWCYMKPGVDVLFIRHRLKFGGAKNNAPFPSMIVVFHGKE